MQLQLLEGLDDGIEAGLGAGARANSPSLVTKKSRLPKSTCAPRIHLMSWLAICGLVVDVKTCKSLLPSAPTVGVLNHRLVNLYLRVWHGW
jgi:hypothetical protein